MIKITSTKKLRNDRYVIEILKDDELIPHIVSENTIIKYTLLIDKELSEADYKKMIKDNEYELLYLKAISFISYQMRTISEVKKHLAKDTKNQTIIKKVITELKENRYLNDLLFVKEYVTQKIEFDLVGPRYIKDKLIQKGIHYDLITDALLVYNEDIQYDKIYQIIHKEIKFKQKKPYQKVYLSLKQKLLTKGFSSNVVESSLLSSKDDIIAQIDEESLLKADLKKIKNKYNISDFEEKNKLIKKLMSKGHNYELIKKHINEE